MDQCQDPRIAIRVKSLEIRFDAKPAVDQVSFQIESGDFVGILGPNGAGKTTLLRSINGLLTPSEGAVLIEGRDTVTIKRQQLARQLAAVPQKTSIDFAFTVEAVVMMGRTPYIPRFGSETAEDQRIVDEALANTGITHLAGRLYNTLSGGEQQRVIIARALAQQPSILLLDEPTAHLDVHHQVEIMDLLAQINQRRNLTVINVLHDINLASLYCRHLILLHEGRVAAAGTPEQVITGAQLRPVYGDRLLITRHPTRSQPQIALLPKGS